MKSEEVKIDKLLSKLVDFWCEGWDFRYVATIPDKQFAELFPLREIAKRQFSP